MVDDRFWELRHLSDRELLASLHGALRTQRRSLAEVVAHLAEVEERRLHLQAACGSLFSYCVQRLGMSEDEACRRIELARLARRFPALFGELAGGGISLSVALLLKPVLSMENHAELIASVRGASLQRARELLAARFPKPDVPAQIRKLPERKQPTTVDVAVPAAANAGPPQPHTRSGATPCVPALLQSGVPQPTSEAPRPAAEWLRRRHYRHQRIEPLSAGRYRVQLTADASLKRKLERARDLLRHAHPDGDLCHILSRALDLLIDDMMKRRFGARRKPGERKADERANTETADRKASGLEQEARLHSRRGPTELKQPLTTPMQPAPASSEMPAAPNSRVAGAQDQRGSAPRRTPVSRAARRAVLERDGLGCSWVDAEGHRCDSTAWLEVDHHQPVARGGGSDPGNLRLLCRAHNRLAAERAYGRSHVERSIAERQCNTSGMPPRP